MKRKSNFFTASVFHIFLTPVLICSTLKNVTSIKYRKYLGISGHNFRPFVNLVMDSFFFKINKFRIFHRTSFLSPLVCFTIILKIKEFIEFLTL